MSKSEKEKLTKVGDPDSHEKSEKEKLTKVGDPDSHEVSIRGCIFKRTLSYVTVERKGKERELPKITYHVQGVARRLFYVTDFNPPLASEASPAGKSLPDKESLLKVDADAVIQIPVRVSAYQVGSSARIEYAYLRPDSEEVEY